ncbi:hypothetical protein QE450_004384 [Paenibacillus sp. SORGH_AS306]|uniref:Uncharacterized protein n=1 Tax=Paenibacillus kyungheensis TaxID=1452732 RepID=A0AAX3M206_9BACL|nr:MULTISPECIES: hypothetical protein [Paenibacillus]MDQ1236886.1 hypothetical protein [Paenibacillus sp. SORGH_AS_0306]MDR6109248.1 hypothetical protein [Paenibacillus sp. SORGH_AS_0338]WCT56270.1 hypothetical protein PQ456_01700 [Paenibacillus kyungheensis]
MTTTKKSIQLPVLHRTRRVYDNLRICRKCQNYTILPGDACPDCGKQALVPVTQHARLRAKRKMMNEILFALLLTIIAVVVSKEVTEIVISVITGAVCIAVLVLVQRRMISKETLRQLARLFKTDSKTIYEGTVRDQSTAVTAVRSGEDVEGYHMLRQAAVVVHNDRLRLAQLSLLQNFRLRSDMDLDLDSLIVQDFDPLLAEYIGEIAKIKREMVKDRAIRYVIANEPQILKLENGMNILVSVTSAAVRMKRYVTMYPGFVRRYARFLPKDRFLRLYRMINNDPAQKDSAMAIDLETIRQELYKGDSDFEPAIPGIGIS